MLAKILLIYAIAMGNITMAASVLADGGWKFIQETQQEVINAEGRSCGKFFELMQNPLTKATEADILSFCTWRVSAQTQQTRASALKIFSCPLPSN